MEQNGFGQVDVVASENSGACGARCGPRERVCFIDVCHQ